MVAAAAVSICVRIGEMCEGGDGRYDRPRHRKSSDMIAYLVVFFGFGFEEDGSNHDSGSKSPRLSDDWDAEGNVFFLRNGTRFSGDGRSKMGRGLRSGGSPAYPTCAR